MYGQLYKFDVKAELNEYNLPFGEEEEEKQTVKPGDKVGEVSKATSFYDN